MKMHKKKTTFVPVLNFRITFSASGGFDCYKLDFLIKKNFNFFFKVKLKYRII